MNAQSIVQGTINWAAMQTLENVMLVNHTTNAIAKLAAASAATTAATTANYVWDCLPASTQLVFLNVSSVGFDVTTTLNGAKYNWTSLSATVQTNLAKVWSDCVAQKFTVAYAGWTSLYPNPLVLCSLAYFDAPTQLALEVQFAKVSMGMPLAKNSCYLTDVVQDLVESN